MNLPKPTWKIPSGLFQTVYGLPAWQKIAIWLASMAIPIALSWFLFLSPRMDEMNNLSGKIPQLQREVRELEAKEAQIPQLEEELKIMEGILTKAVRLLPEQKDIPSILTDISSLGNEARLQFQSFKPEKERPQDFYAAIPVDIKLTGPFHNTVGFFDRVVRMARIVHINTIEMGNAKENAEVWSQKAGSGTGGESDSGSKPNPVAETKSSEAGQDVPRAANWVISTSCEAVTYRFLSPEEQEAAKTAAQTKR